MNSHYLSWGSNVTKMNQRSGVSVIRIDKMGRGESGSGSNVKGSSVIVPSFNYAILNLTIQVIVSVLIFFFISYYFGPL